jgi:hypothetical protein
VRATRDPGSGNMLISQRDNAVPSTQLRKPATTDTAATKTHTCPNEDRETASDYGASWRWRAARTSLVSLRSTPNQRAGLTQQVCTGRNGSAASPPLPLGRRAPRRAGDTEGEACRRRRRPTCAGGRGSAASACTHMSHVTTKSCSWSRWCSSPSVTYALAHVTSKLKLRGHAPPCGGPRSEEWACRRRPCRTRWRARQSRPTIRHRA